MEEKTFFSYDDVKVTSARFISGGQTFAMSNITSVKAIKQTPRLFGGILVLLLGLLLIAGVPIVGVSIALLAAFYLFKQKTVYHVMLATAGGEISALKTYQKEYLDKVVSAVNEAIVYRG